MKSTRISLWSTILFMLLVGSLHLIKPELDPSWRFISEYAIGENGWMMTLAFLAWAVAYLALFFALYNQLKTTIGKIGLAMLLISAAGLLLASIFTTDPVTTENPTTSGQLHSLGGTLGMAMPLASLFICIALYNTVEWSSVSRYILVASILVFVGFLVSVVSLGYLLTQSNGIISPDTWVGYPTRFEALTYCIWLIVVSTQVDKVYGSKTIVLEKSR